MARAILVTMSRNLQAKIECSLLVMRQVSAESMAEGLQSWWVLQGIWLRTCGHRKVFIRGRRSSLKQC